MSDQRIPRDGGFDRTSALLAEGYRFIPERCRRHGSDIFETRLMLRRAYCVTGADAARMFYHPGRFTRRGAMPSSAQRSLQDKGSVQTLDGEAHRHRKELFTSLLNAEGVERLSRVFAEEWRRQVPRWAAAGRVRLHSEVQGVLCRAACRWAGLEPSEAKLLRRTREFGAMIGGAGSMGPRNWRGLLLRRRTERWVRVLLRAVRSGRLRVPEGSPVAVVARHADLEGRTLDVDVAAVELINFLRPIVAVAWYIAWTAVAVHEHPELRPGLASGAGEDGELERFAQEVRRFYPFFPFVGGRALEDFEWRDWSFPAGTWMILDLYGTNRDPRTWSDPEVFRPGRFREWDGSPFNFIAQGGGDTLLGHRCPGERATIELIKTSAALLVSAMNYEVPEQDLAVDLSRMPAVPKSGFVMENVRET